MGRALTGLEALTGPDGGRIVEQHPDRTESTVDRALAEEYERFGPWIDEVRSESEVPRLFREHGVDLDRATLVLKVPRNIQRRDVTPGMDLYDHLLVLGTDRLTVLSRRAGAGPASARTGGVGVLDVPVEQIAAVHDVVNLLDGRLTVHTTDGRAVEVRYNGSARSSVARLVDLLRGAAGDRPPSHVGAALLAAARSGSGGTRLEADTDLLADLREVAGRVPGLEPWAAHGRVRLAPRGGGAGGLLQAALHAISPATLQSAVVAGDDVAMEVIGRHAWLVRGSKPVHSASRLVVPLAALERVAIAPHEYPGAMTVALGAGQGIAVVVPDGSAAHRLFASVVRVR